jgi:uncharacterized OB-fold protein
MHLAPDTVPLDLPPLQSTIALPYRLTPGKATGTFLAELAARRIVGTRCLRCQRVEVPAQDVCSCGHAELEFVAVSTVGTLQSYTRMPDKTLGLIRLDGCDCDLLHRLHGDHEWAVGQRLQACWSDSPQAQALDLLGFEPAGQGAMAGLAPAAFEASREPLDSMATELKLHYQHAAGPYYGRLFDEMRTSGRIMGIRCSHCQSTLLPPRELCDVCYERTGTWADVADTGVLQAFSIIHLKFIGQRRDPPYVYAEVMLDGASTKIIHMLDGVDIEAAPARLKPGMRVKAVWKAERKGSLDDISHFELIDPI